MMTKLLGFFDMVAAIVMVLYQYDVTGFRIVLSFAAYLILKGIIFFGDLFSVIDGIVGIYMIIMFFIHSSTVTWIFAIYLILKSIWSMAS